MSTYTDLAVSLSRSPLFPPALRRSHLPHSTLPRPLALPARTHLHPLCTRVCTRIGLLVRSRAGGPRCEHRHEERQA